MKNYLGIFILIFSLGATAQETVQPDFAALDSLYREDQFYFSFTYNILTNMPKKMSQNKFSVGLSGGFLRDFPLNENRTFAIAVGLGYTLQNYNYNLVIDDTGGDTHYEYISDDIYYEKNKLSLNYADLPIEIRWRTSTPESHKFWRVYTGFKLSYLFNSRAKFVGDGTKILITNDDHINKIRYGAYVSAGYNTWNLYAYYGLNPIFKEGTVEGQKLEMSTLSLGLMFYIL